MDNELVRILMKAEAQLNEAEFILRDGDPMSPEDNLHKAYDKLVADEDSFFVQWKELKEYLLKH